MGKEQDRDARGGGLVTHKWMWWSPVRALYSYKDGQSERTCRGKSVSATHIFETFCELCLDVPENVTDHSLGGHLVPDIQGRGVR